MNDLVDSFSNRLNKAMHIRNIKAKDLSEKTGIAKSSLSEYINGKYEAKQDGVYLLAKALDVNEAWLMGCDVPMNKINNIKDTLISNAKKQFIELISSLNLKDFEIENLFENFILIGDNYYNELGIHALISYYKKFPKNNDDLFFSSLKLLIDTKIINEDTNTYINKAKEIINSNLKGTKVPILGYIKAGIPISAIEEIIDYEEIPETLSKKGQFFALVVKGDSMEPDIKDGDIAILLAQPDIENGDIGAVIFNGNNEATLKRIYKDKTGITLVPDNINNKDGFKLTHYTNKEIREIPITIAGKLMEVRKRYY